MIRALLALVLACGVAVADDKKSPADKLAAIKKAQDDAQAEYRKYGASLKDDPDGRKKFDEFYKAFDAGQGERFMAAVEIAKADPKADTAIPALEWVLTIPRSYYLPAGVAAMEEVTKHHAANPKVGKIVAWVGYYAPHRKFNPKEHAAAWAMVDAVANTNPDKAAQAQAYMVKAHKTKRVYDELASEHGLAPKSEMGAKLLAIAAVAEAEYMALIKEYGDQPRLAREKSGTVGEFAKSELYELQHLCVGRVAPEIECEGVDGKKFKLSDHRGKVVAVVFWAAWCGPCMADVPHEREMTERLHGKPFTIVGINGDDKREKALEVMAKEKMTWPSFWNGEGGPDGNVAKAWNVRSWPTVYVLDAKGVIRFKGPRGKLLEEKVNVLLEAMGKK